MATNLYIQGPVKNPQTFEVLKKLDVLPYKDRKNVNPVRVDGTCGWFTDHPLYQTWRDSTTSGLLWVSADPGCGKSDLAKYLVDEVLLSMVVAAERPLSLAEMAVALAVKEHHRTYADLKLEPEERFRQTVRELCGLFITIVDSKIYLLHQTTKEFLVKGQALDAPTSPVLRWKHSLELAEAHRILTRVCVGFLLIFSDTSKDVHLDEYFEDITYEFLDYAAKHWVIHYREARFENDDSIQDSALRLFDQERIQDWYYQGDYDKFSYPPSCPAPAFTLLSYFGFDQMVKRLLRRGGPISSFESPSIMVMAQHR